MKSTYPTGHARLIPFAGCSVLPAFCTLPSVWLWKASCGRNRLGTEIGFAPTTSWINRPCALATELLGSTCLATLRSFDNSVKYIDNLLITLFSLAKIRKFRISCIAFPYLLNFFIKKAVAMPPTTSPPPNNRMII